MASLAYKATCFPFSAQLGLLLDGPEMLGGDFDVKMTCMDGSGHRAPLALHPHPPVCFHFCALYVSITERAHPKPHTRPISLNLEERDIKLRP